MKETMPAVNALKQKWSRGEPAFGAWLSIPSAFAAEAVARVGFDYVCIDMQHGLVDYSSTLGMLQAIAATSATPVVRVPQNNFAAINQALDAGALGIIVPMIDSVEDARAAVEACRYPPAGKRSYGPTRAAISAGPDYFANANELVACIPMIETRRAAEEIEQILAVPGIDAVYVGPNDLSLALGQPPAADNPGPYQEVYARVPSLCAERGITAGIHAKAGLAAKHVATGYRMITISSDVSCLVAGSVRDLKEAREGA